jgi:hypothetical protein
MTHYRVTAKLGEDGMCHHCSIPRVSIATRRSAVAAGHFVVGYVIPNCSMYVLYLVGS